MANDSGMISRKVLKQIAVSELQPDETVDAVREARLLAKVTLIA
jgi:signal recognition particle subunit SEC65